VRLWFRLAILIAATAVLSCQTSRSWDEGCPGVYSGVRYFQDQVGGLPLDGKIFFLLDLPVSVALDTVLLPASVFMKPTAPQYGFAPGCQWAAVR
jgi:uncharacterized protein YceK